MFSTHNGSLNKETSLSGYLARKSWGAGVIVAIFVLFSLLWIPLTDWLLSLYFQDARTMSAMQSVKGIVYIIIMGFLLYYMITRGTRELVRAENRSRENYNLLECLIDSLDDLIYFRDPTGKFIAANKSYSKLAGKSRDEIVGSHLETSSQSWEEDNQVISLGQAISKVKESSIKDRKQYWWVTKVPYIDSAGDIRGVIAISRDITQQRTAELERQQLLKRLENEVTERNKELTDKVALLENVFHLITDAVFVVYPAKREILMCNPAVEKLLGYTAEELQGEDTRIIHTDQQAFEEFRRLSETELNNRGNFSIQWRLQRKDGKLIDVEINQTPMQKDNWQAGVVSIIRDISGQKLAENVVDVISRISEKISVANSLDSGLAEAISITCRSFDWSFGEIWMPDDEDEHLLLVSSYNDGSAESREISGERSDLLIPRGKGLPGKAWETQKALWLTTDDPEWREYKYFNKAGVQAAYALPVRTQSGHTLVFLFLLKKFYPEDVIWVSLVKAALTSVSILLEKLSIQEKYFHVYDRLRKLTARLHELREEERADIARDLHDNLGSSLTSLKLDLNWIGSKIKHSSSEINIRLDMMDVLLGEVLAMVREMSLRLHPPMLENLGLQATLQWYTQDFEQRTGISCEAVIKLEHLTPHVKRDISIFRILQEALTNISRHANASRVNIHVYADENLICLEIQDDGIGIPDSVLPAQKSLGIVSMQERTEILGGSIKITGKAGQGTRIQMTVPVTE